MAQVGVPSVKGKTSYTSIDKGEPMEDNPLWMLLQMIGLLSLINLLLPAGVPQAYSDAHKAPEHESIITPGIHGGQDPDVEGCDCFVFAVTIINNGLFALPILFRIGVEAFEPRRPAGLIACLGENSGNCEDHQLR